jgi:branched-chain amino acid transport system ATP-binding protein
VSDDRLDIGDLHAGYGQMEVVTGIALQLRPGEVVAMLGRNGAGKSTTLAAVAGMRSGWCKGRVEIDNRSVSGHSAAQVAGAGMMLVPEGRRIFREMTVSDNLHIGAYLRRRRPKSDLTEDLEKVTQLFPVLAQFAKKTAGSLSGGEQQMLAIGQALMSRPRYLLLDEPTSGLAPGLCEQLYRSITNLAATGIGVLVVEQSVDRALRHTDRTYVMETGQIVLQGQSHTLAQTDIVNNIVMGITTPAPT